jgi:hypothetical protein
MDVLEYWSPDIDWNRFTRGPLSSPMWSQFKQLAQLCHAHQHWSEEVRRIRLSPPRRSDVGEENIERRRAQWQHEVERAEGHMHRAATLAAEKMSGMRRLVQGGTPERKLFDALSLATDLLGYHANARCWAAAFDSFDGTEELADDAQVIADRWLKKHRRPRENNNFHRTPAENR